MQLIQFFDIQETSPLWSHVFELIGNSTMIHTAITKKKVKGFFTIKNDRGLHTRPATEIVKCTSAFKSDIYLTYQKNQVNAKSILGVLMLAAGKGAKIRIEATGEDAEEAMNALIDLANANFNIKY